VERLKTAFADNLWGVALFGSQARGDAAAGSDYDLFIVLEGLPNRPIERQVHIMPRLGRKGSASIIATANGVTKYLAFTLHPHPCPLPFRGEGTSSPWDCRKTSPVNLNEVKGLLTLVESTLRRFFAALRMTRNGFEHVPGLVEIGAAPTSL